LLHLLLEGLEVRFGLAGQAYKGKGRDFIAKGLWIEIRVIPPDKAIILERPDPSQAGRRRNFCPLREFHIRDTSFPLEFMEDAPVNGIELVSLHGLPNGKESFAWRFYSDRDGILAIKFQGCAIL
jgi:hypothetical protein